MILGPSALTRECLSGSQEFRVVGIVQRVSYPKHGAGRAQPPRPTMWTVSPGNRKSRRVLPRVMDRLPAWGRLSNADRWEITPSGSRWIGLGEGRVQASWPLWRPFKCRKRHACPRSTYLDRIWQYWPYLDQFENDIPESKIRERWVGSRATLIRLLAHLAHRQVFDNSAQAAAGDGVPRSGGCPRFGRDALEWARPVLQAAIEIRIQEVGRSRHAHEAHGSPMNLENDYSQLSGTLYTRLDPVPVVAPRLIKFNEALATELRLELNSSDPEHLARIFSGNEKLPGSQPIALAYAGHQFGSFVPRLGDGRAVLLGEARDHHGNTQRHTELKGAGRTAYSRGGDGRAALGPVLREYLVSEAMTAMGIASTRSLAAVWTGERVRRGPASLPGAILTRVASSHVRVGTFQYLAAQGDTQTLRSLADYVIDRHYPEARQSDTPYRRLLDLVVGRQAVLIAQWMKVGFIHGVMNTDNTSVVGETIDYGPCAFMDTYDPQAVFSSIDCRMVATHSPISRSSHNGIWRDLRKHCCRYSTWNRLKRLLWRRRRSTPIPPSLNKNGCGRCDRRWVCFRRSLRTKN